MTLKGHSKRSTSEMNPIEYSQEVEVTDGSIRLPGNLVLPPDSSGIVIFAHGSGSSRLSPRNLQVAQSLNQRGLGTLLFDLLTLSEAEDRENVFNIPFLASRLVTATHWVRNQTQIRKTLPIGYFGASTGGGAALWAAADLGDEISAVVSRGGRPDLAIPRLREVKAPTLLIVGGDDEAVIEMNQEALQYLTKGNLVIIPGATHLFEEPGTLESVSEQARNWFIQNFTSSDKKSAPDHAA
jgi:putative phosphoribosyl transferase